MALLWRDLEWTLRSTYEWQPLDFNRVEFSLRLFRRHLSVWQTLCRIQSWALHRTGHTPCIRLSLSTQISFMRSHFVLHDGVWTPQVRALLAFLFEEYYIVTCQGSALERSQQRHWREQTRKKWRLCFNSETWSSPKLDDTNHLLQGEGWRLKRTPQDAHKD